MRRLTLIFTIFLCVYTNSLAQLDSTLLSFIKANSVEKADSLLQSYTLDINATDDNGANALMWACYHADSSMVALLFDNGAKAPNEAGGIYYKGQTQDGTRINGWYGSLQGVAAGNGKDGVIKHLLDVQKMDVDIQVSHPTVDSLSMWTPLMYAAHFEKPTNIKILLERNAKTGLLNSNKESAMSISLDSLISRIITNKDFSKLDSLNSFQINKAKTFDLYRAANYKKCIQLLELNLDFVTSLYGNKHLHYEGIINNLAVCHNKIGDFTKAIELAEQSLDLFKELVSENHQEYNVRLNNIARSYQKIGEYEKAEELFFESIENAKMVLGEDHPKVNIRLYNLATLYSNLGEYEKALPLFLKVKNNSKRIGESSSKYSKRLSALALLYSKIGENEKARRYYEEAISVSLKANGVNHPLYATLLSNYGKFLTLDANNLHEALQLLEKSSEIFKNNYGEDGDNYIISLKDIGNIYRELEEFDKAEALYKEAVEIARKKYGINHIVYSFPLYNLGLNYDKLGLQNKALPCYLDALEIVRNTYGIHHNFYFNKAMRLSFLYEKINQADLANLSYLKVVNSLIGLQTETLPFLTMESQVKWKEKYQEYTDIINSFYLNNPDFLTSNIVDYNLALKTSIDNYAAENNIGNEANKYKYWIDIKKRLARELSLPLSRQSVDFDSLLLQSEELEVLIRNEDQNLLGKFDKISTGELKESISDNEIIIDIVHFDYYKNGFSNKSDSVYYVANIISPNQKKIQQVKLFQEKELIDALERNNHDKGGLYSSRGLSPKPNYFEGGVLSFIWEPILPHLKGVKKVYVSPSGMLNKFNLGAIPIDEKNVFSDRFELLQYNSLRSKLIKNDRYDNNDFLMIGSVDYEYTNNFTEKKASEELVITTQAEYVDENILGLRNSIGQKWKYLPGTELELSKIEKIVDGKKYKLTTLKEKNASEEIVKEKLSQNISPRVLHIATHGFFYDDVESKDVDRAFLASDNPMIRSGLVLSNANYAWQTGDIAIDLEEDGILTAYEVSNLNLNNTELVVLSACETGLGEIHDSEGVFGLQRAFKIAGARYLLMSLWQVSDNETADFMTTFYKHWLQKKKSIPEAYSATQKKMRKKYKDPNLWAGFILVQ